MSNEQVDSNEDEAISEDDGAGEAVQWGGGGRGRETFLFLPKHASTCVRESDEGALGGLPSRPASALACSLVPGGRAHVHYERHICLLATKSRLLCSLDSSQGSSIKRKIRLIDIPELSSSSLH